jgi:hypothetical protein
MNWEGSSRQPSDSSRNSGDVAAYDIGRKVFISSIAVSCRGVETLAERLDRDRSRHDFFTGDSNFASDDGRWVMCLLDVLFVDNSHFVREQVTLLE